MTAAPERVKSRFLSRVNHALRTPLSAIIGHAEFLAGGGQSQAEHGRIILHSARQLVAMLGDVNDYAQGCVRQAPLKPLPVYTASLLEDVAPQARAWARANGNSFDLKVHGAVPLAVRADVQLLRQVLQQLLSNAAKFTVNGRVELGVQVGPATPPGDTAWWRFTVSDTGPGIESEVLAQLFEPLQRPEGSHQRPGLGLGLALAQQWVQRMGGSLDVRSAIGQGSTLTASVPLPTASEEEAAWQDSLQDDDPMPPLDGAGRCVWIVEDCAPVRELLCAHIEAQGFCAVPFAGGCDAIEHIARADTQPPQLIITDSHMPGADGRAVRAQARRRWPGLPVILLTAALDPSALAAQGFSAVLAKPVRRARLHAALEAALDRAARPAAATPPAPGGVRPARAHIARFVEMARFGAVSDIAECADALASTHTQWQPFLAQLKHSAERGDIKGCLDLLA